MRAEWAAFREGVSSLDLQTVTILLMSAVLMIVQLQFGSRRFFRRTFGDHVAAGNLELFSWAWWFVVQGVLGFVIPVFILLVLFKRTPRDAGLGLGDWKLAGGLALAYLPLVIAGTWVLSAGSSFQADYPHLKSAATDWGVFWTYHLLFLFYWMGWEYLWRGFVLFGTARTFGLYAIIIQTVPFAILHASKPLAEGLLSVLGGVALGALVWRCRSFWIAVPIHSAQMLILDIFCALRIRSGEDGLGWNAFQAMLDYL
ncbi:MAG: CPBP family intramembrane glutamic endopeptidase [Bacteroidota bacterium]